MPRAVGGVQRLPIGDESVLLDGWRSATVINTAGTRIWECLDGNASIGQIADRLATAHGASVEIVLADVLDFVRKVGANGLLENVLPPTDLMVTTEPVAAMAAGDSLPDVGLKGADGSTRSLLSEIGEETVLVNWNPHCGYCVSIADRLADLQAAVHAAGLRLVLVSSGDAEANRSLADQAGLRGPILLRQHGQDPFRGAGTPASYHVDRTGLLLSGPAYGFEEVLSMVERLAGLEPTSTGPSDQNDDSGRRTRYLLDRGSMCAPGTGESTALVWAGTRSYRLDGYHIGIRYDTDATAMVLDRLFAGRRVDDPRAGNSFSIALGSTIETEPCSGNGDRNRPRPARGLAILEQGGQPPLRSRDTARVLRALLWRLADATDEVECPPNSVCTNAIAVVSDRGAALLPANFHAFGPRLQPMLAKVGIALVDVTRPEIDLVTAELVLREPPIDHDSSVLEELSSGVTDRSQSATALELSPVLAGRYPLIGWCAITPADRQVTHLSPASAAAAVMSSVEGASDPADRLRQLADLFTRVPGYGLWYHSEAELIAAISAALR